MTIPLGTKNKGHINLTLRKKYCKVKKSSKIKKKFAKNKKFEKRLDK